MKQAVTVTVDYNGIVLFDPEGLARALGGQIEPGTDVLSLLTTSDLGDKVTSAGAAIPIVGLNDSNYEFIVRDGEEQSDVDPWVVVENGIFPLKVSSRLVVADLGVLAEWELDAGWQVLDVPRGTYSARIRGFRQVVNREVARFGFEAVLGARKRLPKLSANLGRSMQVLELPD